MKFSPHHIVSVFVVVLCLSTSVQSQTVTFGLADYSELGFVRDSLTTSFQQLSLAGVNTDANLNYFSVLGQAAGNASTITGVSTATSLALEFGTAAQTMVDTVSVSNIEQLNGIFSPFNTGNVYSALGTLDSQLTTLDAQVANSIDCCTNDMFLAVAASNSARTNATSLLSVARMGRENIRATSNQVGDMIGLFTDYSDRLRTANRVSNDLARTVSDLMDPALGPVNIPLNTMLQNALGAQLDISSIQNRLPSTQNRLNDTLVRVAARVGDFDYLIQSLEDALAVPPLSSEWQTTGTILSGTDGRFNIGFTGQSFSHPTTEIDGEFLLGTLSVYNLAQPVASDFTQTEIRFEAARTVNDPVHGPQLTIGTHDFSTFYVTTPNIVDDPSTPDVDESDPVASADYFSVPFLGINLHIFEETAASFDIYGRYDSPLAVSTIRLTSGSDGGFITQIPEPNSSTLLIFGMIALVGRSRKNGARSSKFSAR